MTGERWEKYYKRDVLAMRKREGKIIDEYIRFLQSQGLKLRRMYKTLNTLKRWEYFLNKPLTKATEKDIEKARGKLLAMDYREWTKYDFVVILGKFYRWLGKKNKRFRIDQDLLHYRLKLHLDKPNDNPPEEEDVRAMLRHATHIRDKFLIAVLYSTGMRIGELLGMKVRHVEYVPKHNAYRFYIPTGKTGPRPILVADMNSTIKEYLEWHPRKDRPDSPLMVNYRPSTKYGQPANYASLRKALWDVAKRAKITRRVNPHRFRHARNRELEKANWSEIHRSKYLGWVPGSKMPMIYSHMAVEETDRLVLQARGETEEELEKKKGLLRQLLEADDGALEEVLYEKVKRAVKDLKGK